MKLIRLTQKQVALVDLEDFDRVNQYKWCFVKHGYAVREASKKEGAKRIYMHRFIMSAPKDLEVDHINGNGLDNRKGNLRIVTSEQNKWNKHNKISGINYHKRDNLWISRITTNGKKKCKYFKNKGDAIIASKQAFENRLQTI